MDWLAARKRLDALRIEPYRVKLIDRPGIGLVVETWLHGQLVRNAVPVAQFCMEQEQANR
ncbi:hypothetical protein PVT71_12365 [Salipiger sp. H15]|uniref:LysR substrate-binding domain-containing protein n=1 Tax=Alloyangia sp. H15 TaxID=3029062 RepID=A0AAU8AEH3_9RHOB